MIRTRLTELRGISSPVVQAAMGYVAGARLASLTAPPIVSTETRQ